jgi:hypothetical protein
VLLTERVRRAADGGAQRAMATAELASTSARNLDALGLHRIWTRALYPVDATTMRR